MRTFTLLLTMIFFNAVHAAPPDCQERADKIMKKFEAAKNMSGTDRTSQCIAITVAISDLGDMYSKCAYDDKFRTEVYIPLAQRIAAETPKACTQ